MMGSLLVSIAYGVEPKTFDHPYIALGEKLIAIADIVVRPGAFLVDSFPFRKLCHHINDVAV